MKLTIEGIKDRAAWEKAGIALPAKPAVRKRRERNSVNFFILPIRPSFRLLSQQSSAKADPHSCDLSDF